MTDGPETSALFVPKIAGALTKFRVRAYAYGPGTDEPSGPYDSGVVDITASSGGETVVAVAAPVLMASNRLALDGLAGAVPGGTITSGAKSAEIVAFVAGPSGTGAVYTGPITGGPFTDNNACTWSGGSGSANGASTAWAMTAGEPYYCRGAGFSGTPTGTETIQRLNSTPSDVGAVTIETTGATPPHYGRKFYKREDRAYGHGADPYASSSTGWLPIGIPTLAPLADDDSYLETAAEPGGGDRVVAVWVRDSIIADAWRATTSSQASIDANPYPTGFELLTPTATTTTTGGVLYRRMTVGTWVYGGHDYAVFGPPPADENRRKMWGLVAEIGGALTPLGTRKVVPSATVVVTDDSDLARFIQRSQDQERLGEPGGAGMQFGRAFGGDGEYIIQSYDVTYPAESDTFGDDWYSDTAPGLYASQSTEGICVDGDLVHMVGGNLFMRPLNPSYRNAEGIYRKSRSANKWTQTKALPDIFGTNDAPYRYTMRKICKVAGSGSGPSTRTLFMAYAPSTTSTGWTTIQIYKSTNGGSSWAVDGGTLSVATYGVPIELWADATALYLNTTTSVWRRTFGGTTWTKATGLAAGVVLHLEKHGSTIYAGVKGKGIYTASDASTLEFSLKKSHNFQWFSVSPADHNRIILAGSSGVPLGTWNNGASWFNVASQAYPGQPGTFEHTLSGSSVWMIWHDTDPNRIVAMRRQHMGKSTDGGKTFYWASRNQDYSEIRGAAFHRSDYQTILMSMTDRLLVVSEHGAKFVMDDDLQTAEMDEIRSRVGNPKALTAMGPLVLDRGTRTGFVAHCGVQLGDKVPLIATRGTSTSRTDPDSTGNGAISVSASPDLPCGEYTLTCTTAAAGGGTFTGVGPIGVPLGTWTVGSARTFTHPRGGTLAVTIADGSVDFKAGANPATFTITINPLASIQILNPATKGAAFYGAVNPAVGYRGISGRHVFEMATDGSIDLIRTNAYDFVGYMGPGGSVILGYSGKSTLMRSTNEGVSWSTWISGTPNFNGAGTPIICASSHDSQRAYIGCANGTVRKIQDGVSKTIFSFHDWCVANAAPGGWPGSTTGASVNIPPIGGVVESWQDPNLVYCATYLFGAPYVLFRTENALATTPYWENISVDATGRGIWHPIQTMFIQPLTGELIATSSHGNIMHRPTLAHRNAYSLTNSLIGDLRAGPGGSYHATAKL